MKGIGIDLTLLVPGRVGGVETYVRSLLDALARLENDNRYLLFGAKPTLDTIALDKNKFAQEVVIPPRGVRNVGFRLARRLLWDGFDYDLVSRSINEHIDQQIGKHRVSVLHEPLGLVRITTRTPVVLTVLDIQHEYHPEFFSPRELEFRRRWHPKSMQRASAIIAISEFTRQTIIERCAVAPEKVITIHFGLDERFQPLVDPVRLQQLRAQYRLPEQFVFYPANSWPHKNHARLLGALKLLKDRGALDFGLVLTGVVYPEHRDLLQQVEELGLGGDVTHLGLIPYADLPCLYALASCLVFPSLFEGFGYPVLEAMGCGCPVVCSNLTSLPEISGGAAILIDPTSEEQIADALVSLVHDESLRADLARRGLARAQGFSWQAAARQTLQVYSCYSRA